jgi:hypothetical protein
LTPLFLHVQRRRGQEIANFQNSKGFSKPTVDIAFSAFPFVQQSIAVKPKLSMNMISPFFGSGNSALVPSDAPICGFLADR